MEKELLMFSTLCVTTSPFGDISDSDTHIYAIFVSCLSKFYRSLTYLWLLLWGQQKLCSLSTRMCAGFLGDNIEEESWLHVTPPAGEVRRRLLALCMLCKNVIEMVKYVSGSTVFNRQKILL